MKILRINFLFDLKPEEKWQKKSNQIQTIYLVAFYII